MPRQRRIEPGMIVWAIDYRDYVKVLEVERKQDLRVHKDGVLYDAGAFKVQRLNGSTTSNFPGYLLRVTT